MRPIDADALKKTLLSSEYECTGGASECQKESYEVLVNRVLHEVVPELIDKAPTIEAEPVRHGRWVYDHNGIVICTECRYPQQIGAKEFCGKCGARMDGVKGLHKQS